MWSIFCYRRWAVFGLVAVLLLGLSFAAQAQDDAEPDSTALAHGQVGKALASGIRFSLTPKTYLRLSFYNQVMVRYFWNNPGSIGANGEAVDRTLDFMLRRNRVLALGEVEQKLVYFVQFGSNIHTISQLSGGTTGPNAGTRPFFHDFWLAWRPGKRFHLGAGLHSVNGISRLSAISSSWNMAMEAPGFNFPNGNTTDQLARQMGIFARGHAGILQYRVAFNSPFSARATNIAADNLNRAYDRTATNLSLQGYFSLNFRYREDDQAFPFYRMAYLGTKKILNMGWGFYYQDNSTESRNAQGVLVPHARSLFGYDIFLEQPFANKSALTLYGVLYDFDFGPNYLQSGGRGNYFSGGSYNGEALPQGGGLNEFTVGSGQIGYLMAGYLLPAKWTGGNGKWQLYGTYTYKRMEALPVALQQWEAGFNYYIYTRNLKITGAYMSRPIYVGTVGDGATGRVVGQKGWMAMMVQLMI